MMDFAAGAQTRNFVPSGTVTAPIKLFEKPGVVMDSLTILVKNKPAES